MTFKNFTKKLKFLGLGDLLGPARLVKIFQNNGPAQDRKNFISQFSKINGATWPKICSLRNIGYLKNQKSLYLWSKWRKMSNFWPFLYIKYSLLLRGELLYRQKWPKMVKNQKSLKVPKTVFKHQISIKYAPNSKK